MPRTILHSRDATFNLRIDTLLKTALTAATEAEDKPAAQVLWDFMRAYAKQRDR